MHPNIVLITTHDTSRHFGCYGVKSVNSANIDALAEEGVRVTRFLATSALCSPSRGVYVPPPPERSC